MFFNVKQIMTQYHGRSNTVVEHWLEQEKYVECVGKYINLIYLDLNDDNP